MMFKALKWAYEMGVRHERRRVRLLIAEYSQKKPERPKESAEDWIKDQYERDLSLHYAVNDTLSKLISPDWNKQRQVNVPTIPLDDD